jgi:hypothetical protein
MKHAFLICYIVVILLFPGISSQHGLSSRIKAYETALIKVETELIWHWEDHFTAAEQEKIQHWLNKTMVAVESTLGSYPFEIHFYIYRRDEVKLDIFP